MDWILWIVIIIFFLGSMVGVFVPIIPDALLVWGGFLIYQFFMAEPGQGLSSWFWWGMGAITILLILADVLTNMVFVKKYGGSKWGMAASVLGILVGPFVLGPLGIILGPVLLVFLIEWIQNKDVSLSVKIALGTLAAFFGSAAVKIVLQLVMIIWFFIAI